MLSAALTTTRALADDSSLDFSERYLSQSAVWFDVFGKGFAVFELRTLFAISVSLLVATPLIFVGLIYLLVRKDKWFPFSRAQIVNDSTRVDMDGWKGFFRFPFVFILTSGMVVGLAFLIAKFNPNIAYSSQFSVWRYVPRLIKFR